MFPDYIDIVSERDFTGQEKLNKVDFEKVKYLISELKLLLR